MSTKDVSKKSNRATLIVTAIGCVFGIVFLCWKSAPIMFGVMTIIACSIACGFGLGAGYTSFLNKKGEKIKAE